MKFFEFPSCVVLLIYAHPVFLHAQGAHNDIKFDYQANKIDIKDNTLTGARVGLGNFPLDGISRQYTVQPGFASEIDVGLGINPSDTIVYNVLDRLLFWNGTEFTSPDSSTSIRIDNNGPAPDTIVNSTSGLQMGGLSPPANLISEADGNGEFHSHVEFFLEPNNDPDPPPLPEFGVYGLKLSLTTTAAGIADSDPFLAVFNFGLDEADFLNAIDEFADLLPPEIPGDYDRNGAVNGGDLQVWQQEYGSPSIICGSGADGNNDGFVDGADFLFWQRHFGSTVLAVSSNSTFMVPEPSTAVIAVARSVESLSLAIGIESVGVSLHRINFFINFAETPMK